MLFQVTNPPSRHFILYYQFYLLLIWWKEYLEKTFIRLWKFGGHQLLWCHYVHVNVTLSYDHVHVLKPLHFNFEGILDLLSTYQLILWSHLIESSHSSRWSLIGIFLLCWEIMCLQRVGGSQHNSRVQNFEIFMLHREVKKVWVYWCWFALRWPIRITGML